MTPEPPGTLTWLICDGLGARRVRAAPVRRPRWTLRWGWLNCPKRLANGRQCATHIRPATQHSRVEHQVGSDTLMIALSADYIDISDALGSGFGTGNRVADHLRPTIQLRLRPWPSAQGTPQAQQHRRHPTHTQGEVVRGDTHTHNGCMGSTDGAAMQKGGVQHPWGQHRPNIESVWVPLSRRATKSRAGHTCVTLLCTTRGGDRPGIHRP